jgi:hypothetical protein
MSLGSLTLRAPEVADFVELILLCIVRQGLSFTNAVVEEVWGK